VTHARYFNDHPDTEPFKSLRTDGERAAFVAELHKLKTKLFIEQVERGELPLRPGVARLVAEARAAGVKARACRACASGLRSCAEHPSRQPVCRVSRTPFRCAAGCGVQHQQRAVRERHRARGSRR
jgi:hypothetical protein